MDAKTKLLNEIEGIVKKDNNKLKEKLDKKLNLYLEKFIFNNTFETIITNINQLKNLVKKYENDLSKFVIEQVEFFFKQVLDCFYEERLDYC
ncbi:MAG: hypothetical protein NZZ41_08070 [Candidatus Dojkabacteria bacterium]|nr:hypothetical protein [Candidatus Dojkabacteria bacterium]